MIVLFSQLSLSLFGPGVGILGKKTATCHSTLLRIALRVSTCIIHVQLAESRPEGQCFVSSAIWVDTYIQ